MEPSIKQASSAAEIARLQNGAEVADLGALAGMVRRHLNMKETEMLRRQDQAATAKKVVVCVVLLVILTAVALCFTGAAGQYYPYSSAYAFYTPAQVARVIYWHAYNAIASSTHLMAAQSNQWLLDNVPGYWAVARRAGVIGITLLCAVLLGISGMLYQNAFRNPIAGPSMLGANSGVSLGLMILVLLFGEAASGMILWRYALCYGLGAGILIFVLLAGSRLGRPGQQFDTVHMMLIASTVTQLLGLIVSYVTLYLMSESDYLAFYNLQQMLTVDTSLLSWLCLGVACAVSLLPVWFCRYKMNALSYPEAEIRLLGINASRLRAVALICGAFMVLAAQIHVGSVALVSLFVPFLARSWFGCEFGKQLAGTVCIGTVLLLACRIITDAVPFVGNGLAIGSTVAVVALPLFVLVVAKQLRGWE